MSASNQIQGLHLAPLRRFDDFTAKFELPAFNDLEKWGNRVVKNLMYYQTNYFALFIAVYIIMLIANPTKIICGLIVKAAIIATTVYYFSIDGRTTNENSYKWAILAAPLFIGYLLLTWFDALLLSAFTLLLPFCLTFVHASLRLRNIRNKVANTMESFGPATPMSVFLKTINVTADKLSLE
ncbi:PRA1 family protein 3 isoform X2 [Condylostylus longicornis]|nr:PRA1 family protein 3 isoform X2 [Condylostylus longicornis]